MAARTDESTQKNCFKCRKKMNAYPWKALIFIMGNALGQSATYVGLTSVLEVYFTRFLYVCDNNPKDLATSSTNVYMAITQICALTAGCLADKLIGNFAIQVLGNIFCTLSLCVVLLSSWQYTLEEPSCCYHDNNSTNTSLLSPHPDRCQALKDHTVLQNWNAHLLPVTNMGLAIAGLVVYSLSYGHVNSIQSVFVGDQFSDSPEQAKAKERSFSWFYLWLNVGNVVGEGVMPILRETVGFVYTLCALSGISVLSTVWLWLGTCFYVMKKPECQRCRRCCCSQPQDIEGETQSLLPAEKTTTARQETWRTKAIAFLRAVLPILGVFLPITVFWALMFQQNSTWVAQGLDLDCYLGSVEVPPDAMPSLNDFMIIIIIPLLEYVVIPHLEKAMNIKVKALHKMLVGMLSAAVSFLFAGLLQLYVTTPIEDCRGRVHLAWQLPQYVLITIGEVLVAVTGLEFAYSQASPRYRNILTAMWAFCQSVGTLLDAGVAQIPIPSQYQFFAYAVAMVVVTGLFLVINRNYRYRGDKFPTKEVPDGNGEIQSHD